MDELTNIESEMLTLEMNNHGVDPNNIGKEATNKYNEALDTINEKANELNNTSLSDIIDILKNKDVLKLKELFKNEEVFKEFEDIGFSNDILNQLLSFVETVDTATNGIISNLPLKLLKFTYIKYYCLGGFIIFSSSVASLIIYKKGKKD